VLPPLRRLVEAEQPPRRRARNAQPSSRWARSAQLKDRYGGGGSEWEVIKIFLEGDGGSNKMNTTSNARLRLATEVGQDHASTGVLLALGINNQPHRPENAAEHKPLALLTYTGQAGEHHRSDRFKPESPKTPSRPTELQTDPNSK
jgi:hypothetical protein